MGFADDMQEADAGFDETEAKVSGGGRFSDGRHQAVISELRVEKSAKTGSWQLCWKFAGRDSNTKGRASVRRWDDLPPAPEREQYFKGDLTMIGYSGKLSELAEWCETEAAIGMICTIYVTTKSGNERDFTNVYLNGCTGEAVDVDQYLEGLGVGGSDESDQFVPSGQGNFADDDIPF